MSELLRALALVAEFEELGYWQRLLLIADAAIVESANPARSQPERRDLKSVASAARSAAHRAKAAIGKQALRAAAQQQA